MIKEGLPTSVIVCGKGHKIRTLSLIFLSINRQISGLSNFNQYTIATHLKAFNV